MPPGAPPASAALNTACVPELNLGPYIAFLLKLYLYEFSERIDASAYVV